MKKIILSVVLILSFAVNSASAIEFSTGVSNGFVLPLGTNLVTNEIFVDMSISQKIGDFKFKIWHGQAVDKSNFKETDYLIIHKHGVLALFDIPGGKEIFFGKINLPGGFNLKVLKPESATAGIQSSKSWTLDYGFSAGVTVGTSPYSGDYGITPELSYKKVVAENLTFSANYKHPMGEVSKSSAFDPSLIVKLNFSF